MSESYEFTADEINNRLRIAFAASLIISTLAYILYGILICHAVYYFLVLSKRDHLLTKGLVGIVLLITSAATFYQVYYNWTYSVGLYADSFTVVTFSLNGNIVVLYSVVIMLVQLFWLACVHRMMSHRPQLCWAIITPIGVLSVSSFIFSIAVGILSRKQGFVWPDSTTSVLLRTTLALDLTVDLSTLVVITSQLIVMRRNSLQLKTTISKLSYILCGVTFTSTLIMIAELIINAPQPPHAGAWIEIAITFAPIIPNIYALGILGVLNARTDLWVEKKRNFISSSECRSEALIPGLRFTVDRFGSRRASTAREVEFTPPVMSFVNSTRRSVETEE